MKFPLGFDPSVLAGGAWPPLRQKAMVVTMQPDWDTAPSTMRALAWYAAILIACLTLRYLAQAPQGDLQGAWVDLLAALDSFMRFSLHIAFFVCVFSAMGRWVVPWNCTAKTASPLQFLGMCYTVAGIDQLMRLAIGAAAGDADIVPALLAAKDVATMALGIMVLVDFFRPRPPHKPRRRPQARRVSRFESSTRPAPL
ncbi:hypothetical protein [Ramlibacter sp. AN1133]|uniref:hypothetical protein n=1 Tax=Ramlibacter sp. AN1133 TaxID=3133429 RepID=UPI0030C0C397